MRNLSYLIFFLIISANTAIAGKYEDAMSKAIAKLNNAKDLNTYLESVGIFERIGDAEKEKWLPYYYAGLGYIFTSHTVQEPKEIDSYLDKAQLQIDKAKKLSPNNDEIITLQGYIYMMKVVVDPPTRGPEFSGRAMQEFGRAMGINVENPRALLLYGRMKMGTDQFFGNDVSESCSMIEKASTMFDNQELKSEIDPSWGKDLSEMFIKECQSN